MEFRYHPIIAEIQCSEDGSVILFRGTQLRVKGAPGKEYVHILDRRITVMKIVMECWHGMPPSPEHIVRKILPGLSLHYTNLEYVRRSELINTPEVYKLRDNRKFTSLPDRQEKETLTSYLKRVGMSRSTYFLLKKKYGEK